MTVSTYFDTLDRI
ncbi:hypothetical protein F383_38438 [Gossypium arboreum]|uniref:Uncharacterized protein n=1 Tax=Gossypium arboreum TaxID=29729 RepID=A0A0B0MFA2_GOSAR|nr:hypothetical protein F383_38438 [Gossypium arboreum]